MNGSFGAVVLTGELFDRQVRLGVLMCGQDVYNTMVLSGHEWPYNAATSICIQLRELSDRNRTDRRYA